MSYFNYEYGEVSFEAKIKRDGERLKQRMIERRMRLNNPPKEKLKSQPRKVRFEGEWEPGATNRRHGDLVRESRVRDKENLDGSKKKISLFDPEWERKFHEGFEEIFAGCYELAKEIGSLAPSQSPSVSSCELIQSKEEGNKSEYDSKPPLEHKPKTHQLEVIEVTAEEGELWVGDEVPSLQEKEEEEIIMAIEEPRVQDFPAMGENYIEESQPIPIEKQVDEQETPTEKVEGVQAELKMVEHVDFIGVDRFDVHPHLSLIVFFNNLRRIEVQHGLCFKELWFTRRIKHRRYSKHVVEWPRRLKSPKRYSRIGCIQGWEIRVMHSQDSRTNLLEEEGYDVIWPSLDFNPIRGGRELWFEDLNTFRFKDRAWKFKGKSNKLMVSRATKGFRDNQPVYGVPKDWAWKFKRKICLKIIQAQIN